MSRDTESEGTILTRTLGMQQQALKSIVAAANLPGNIEGLFAFHVLHDDHDAGIQWQVDFGTEEWLKEHESGLDQSHLLAAIGYLLFHFGPTVPPAFQAAFNRNVERLRLRDPFPDDRISFAHQPVTLLGLALGSIAEGSNGLPHRAWLSRIVQDSRLMPATLYQTILYAYIRYRLTGDALPVDNLEKYANCEEVAALEWTVRQNAVQFVDPHADLSDLQVQVLVSASKVRTDALDTPRSAIVLSAVDSALARSASELVLSRSHVAVALNRFEAAMRRWRWDDDDKQKKKPPIRWPVTSEREVQDVVWLILRSLLDDVVDEETLPKFGHSTYRADFGIPSLRLLVEAKYARKAGDFKEYEKEIMEDAIGYLVQTNGRYDRILIFIYDNSASVQEHGVTTDALRALPQIEDVVIVSRPSQLPEDQEGIWEVSRSKAADQGLP